MSPKNRPSKPCGKHHVRHGNTEQSLQHCDEDTHDCMSAFITVLSVFSSGITVHHMEAMTCSIVGRQAHGAPVQNIMLSAESTFVYCNFHLLQFPTIILWRA